MSFLWDRIIEQAPVPTRWAGRLFHRPLTCEILAAESGQGSCTVSPGEQSQSLKEGGAQ